MAKDWIAQDYFALSFLACSFVSLCAQCQNFHLLSLTEMARCEPRRISSRVLLHVPGENFALGKLYDLNGLHSLRNF
jgi:hypothetical protein